MELCCLKRLVTEWLLIPCVVLGIGIFILKRLLVWHWGVPHIVQVNLRGKVAVVTGSGSGIGFATAVELANRGATVVITGRTLKAAKKLLIRIRNKTFLGTLVPMKLNLHSLESVREFCDNVKNNFNSLDLLINNAGLLMPEKEKSVDGFELHFATNHLGHFLLTNLLLPLMKNDGRIVVVGSIDHRGETMDFEDLMLDNYNVKEDLSSNAMYRKSKLANILFAKELRSRLKAKGSNIRVYACCPGIVKTKISRNLKLPWYTPLVYPILGMFLKTAEHGSHTVLHCALGDDTLDDEIILYRHCRPWNQKGCFFPDDILIPPKHTMYSNEDAKRLWVESENLCSEHFDI